MKKTIIGLIVIAAVIVMLVIFGRTPSTSNPDAVLTGDNNPSPTVVVPATETTKVSSKTSQFVSSELGFSVNYPNNWEANGTDNGVSFVMPIDQSQVSTIAKLQADITVSVTKCGFPPVTTVSDRGTITVGTDTLNTISMTNTVKGRTYFNRMYSLQKGAICYGFSFSSIALSPESKNLTGSNLTQAKNNNKAIINTADADFTSMVKSFALVTGPAGVDETKAPAKK